MEWWRSDGPLPISMTIPDGLKDKPGWHLPSGNKPLATTDTLSLGAHGLCLVLADGAHPSTAAVPLPGHSITLSGREAKGQWVTSRLGEEACEGQKAKLAVAGPNFPKPSPHPSATL